MRTAAGTPSCNAVLSARALGCKLLCSTAAAAPAPPARRSGSTCCSSHRRLLRRFGRCTWCSLGSAEMWRTVCGCLDNPEWFGLFGSEAAG